jgi:predicted phosphoribosyltransferase
MSFSDRAEAGRRLAAALDSYRSRRPVVLALPRGGVPVAAEVADFLRAPLDLIPVRKIGVPFPPELAMGAVVDGGRPLIVRNDDVIREPFRHAVVLHSEPLAPSPDLLSLTLDTSRRGGGIRPPRRSPRGPS